MLLFIGIYSLGGPSEIQTLKWCSASVGLYSQAEVFSIVTSHLFSKQHQHLLRGKMSKTETAQKRQYKNCADVVTCRCWRASVRKVLLLFK